MTPVARRTASANAFIDLNIQSLSPYRGLFGDVAAVLRHKVHHVHLLNVLLPQHRDWSSEF